jgi:hypothetical protein
MIAADVFESARQPFMLFSFCDTASYLHAESERLAATRSSLARVLERQVRRLLDDAWTNLFDDAWTNLWHSGKSLTLLDDYFVWLLVNDPVYRVDLATSSPVAFKFPSAWPRPRTGLPAWRTGVLSKFGLSDWPAADSGAPASAAHHSRVQNAWASVTRLVNASTGAFKGVASFFANIGAAAIRQIDIAQSAISLEAARRRAVLARKRSAPDDRAAMPMRRHRQSWGVAACA